MITNKNILAKYYEFLSKKKTKLRTKFIKLDE